jgi:hypothetical protein
MRPRAKNGWLLQTGHYGKWLALSARGICIRVASRDELEKKQRYYTEQILGCYCTVMPYEKAKLQAITISGDPNKPLHMTHDLSVLSDDELHVLARILPKLGGSTEEDAAGDDVPPGSRRTTAAPGTARDRGNRKGLRKAKKATDR